MSRYVLDASALLVLLNTEPGHEQVEAILDDAIISAVNFAEVMTKLVDAGHALTETRSDLESLALEVIPFDQQSAFESAALRKATRSAGLSLGDRACLGLASATNRVAVSADRAWGRLRIGVKVQLLRGSRLPL